MAAELFSKEILLGLGGALSVGINGWLAFSRYWISNRAKNANDNQQIDMLDKQEKYIERLEKTNSELRADNAAKDETIRQYWKTIADTQARLQIIESSQKHLEEQNESLKAQVRELTTSNMNLVSQIAEMRKELRVSR
ncbi:MULTISPECIES: hypothetical protein [unclassified Pantoea]|uniref:hypothetical protein n=1 Tax=unclassified Pantoea TaxID=2630326 RepID=UPI0012329262|nr:MULTISPECIES: hypothetical protein [unclassified Pantoea]KAA5932337.1 hypothetical protein F3I59_04735 [Pantoea sp. VH_8]KAA5937398.1 hypothetical protein F3I58_04765 [Pantoea sp. VH_4]